jgi:hypothetical protein
MHLSERFVSLAANYATDPAIRIFNPVRRVGPHLLDRRMSRHTRDVDELGVGIRACVGINQFEDRTRPANRPFGVKDAVEDFRPLLPTTLRLILEGGAVNGMNPLQIADTS